MASHPVLPGFHFENIQVKNFHLSQQFNVVNGYNIPKINLNDFPDEYEPLLYLEKNTRPYNVKNTFIKFDPLEEFTKFKKPKSKAFTPRFVLHDGKCLAFHGYYKQDVPECSSDTVLYRKINLIYYLEDDTMTIIEPPVPNSGYPQGRLVRRGRITKPNSTDIWQWKNLNVGKDIEVYGIKYHLSSCDQFTRTYLQREGIEVNADEEIPSTVLHSSIRNRKCGYYYGTEEITPAQDKLYKFLQYDRKVLRFYALWNDSNDTSNEIRLYKMYYYLIDDTVEIRETKTRFSQNDQFTRLLSRTRLSKNTDNRPGNVTVSVSCQTSDQEFYEPKDFTVGECIYVLGRKFLIYDCDEFTRKYYKEYLKIEQPSAISIEEKFPEPTKKAVKMEIPPHSGIGQPEDTLQSCLHIVPRPPKKDVIHFLENTNKTLRYSAKLNTELENDAERQFIFQFSLADGKLSIYEIQQPNSGFTAGYFLKSTLVPKPSTTTYTFQQKPEYYTPTDFIIGQDVNIFGRKFTITGADLAVYRYMEKMPHKFPEEIRNSIKQYLQRKGILENESENVEDNLPYTNEYCST